jgi:superfamily I DNA/RNA helicase
LVGSVDGGLRKPEEDTLYIFYDDSQPLYRKDWQFPQVGPVVTLTENCRNTKLIHREAMKYYCGSVPSDPVGPEGRAPQFVKLSNQEDEKTVVESIIRDLIRKEKVSPNQITILTPRTEKKSIWKSGEVVCGCRLDWSPDAPLAEKTIWCSTIHAFKGLESPVVVLSETSKIYDKARDQLLYVAMSRAMSHLVVVGL